MARIFWVDSSVDGVVTWSSLMLGYLASNASVIGVSHFLIASWLFDMTRRILTGPAAAGCPAAAGLGASDGFAASAGLDSAGLAAAGAWVGGVAWPQAAS